MVDQPRILRKFQISVYVIFFVFTITRFILLYLDKKCFDLVFKLDLIIESLLLVSFTICLFIKKINILAIFFGFNGLLWFINNIIPFFEYYNLKTRDYFSTFNYMVGWRIALVFAYIPLSIVSTIE